MLGIKDNIVKLYFGRCDIEELIEAVDERGVTVQERKLKYSDLPCRIVFGSRQGYGALRNTDKAHRTSSMIDLRVFLDPDIDVKPGSVLSVRQGGRVYSLRCSAQAAVYRHHQEIMALPDYSEV